MKKIDTGGLARSASQRSGMWDLLSGIYRSEPTLMLIERLRAPAFSKAFKELGFEIAEYLKGRSSTEIADELAVEYTRLFVGPGKHIYPYESAYTNDKSGIAFSAASSQFKDLIKSYGLGYRTDFCGAFDHIGVELEFMGKAVSEEAAAWSQAEHTTALKYLKLQKEFLKKHLLKWVPKFLEAVINRARRSFYRDIGMMTKGYISSEADEIRGLVNRFGSKQRGGK
ncbi:MAG: molecular chaperone TorD family protein [Candidatus Omnitrophica bacterium]|nr:molecular chaperone TorD family protein [Candidatus Omnitrophota bacterium]